MTAPSALLAQHRDGSRQLLEALSDLRPSLFRELAEGAVFAMVDAAEKLEQRADDAARLVQLRADVLDVLEEVADAFGGECPRDLSERVAELSEQLRALTGNDDESR